MSGTTSPQIFVATIVVKTYLLGGVVVAVLVIPNQASASALLHQLREAEACLRFDNTIGAAVSW